MAYQLIYTSAPRGLVSGRTGFVTVARHRQIPERLVSELEKDSNYERLPHGQVAPVIRRFAFYPQGEEEFWALGRICESGMDYTHRPCHLAHHLLGTRHENLAATPLDWLTQWQGFLNRWDSEPQWLGAESEVDMGSVLWNRPSVGALPDGLPGSEEFWKKLATSATARPIFIYRPEQEELLFRAWQWAMCQVSSARQWRISFTSFLKTGENDGRYIWCAGYPQSAAASLASRNPERVVDLDKGCIAEELLCQVCKGERMVRRGAKAPHVDYQPSGRASVRNSVSSTNAGRPGVGAKPVSSEFPLTEDVSSVELQSKTVKLPLLLSGMALLIVIGGAFGWWMGNRQESVGHIPRIVAESKEHTDQVLESLASKDETPQISGPDLMAGEPVLVVAENDVSEEPTVSNSISGWHRAMPAIPVKFLVDLDNKRELMLAVGNDIELENTLWSVVDTAQFPLGGESLTELHLVKNSGTYPAYQIAYDVFAILGVEQRVRAGQRHWVFQPQTLSAEIFRQNSRLLALQRPHGYLIHSLDKVPLMLIWKSRRVADFNFEPLHATLEEVIESHTDSRLRLQPSAAQVLKNFGLGNSPENSTEDWLWVNEAGEKVLMSADQESVQWLAVESKADRNQRTRSEPTSGSGRAQLPKMQWVKDLDWLRQTGPWKLRYRVPGTEQTLDILIVK